MAGRNNMAVVATSGNSAALKANLQVNVCGRLLDIPPTASSSLTLLCRELASQLKMSSSVALHLADIGGIALRTDKELAAALRDGRHPFQASPTVAALREIEQKKYEVETSKEQMAQFQWQIMIDQMTAFSHEVTQVAANLASVQAECKKTLQEQKEQDQLQLDKILASLEFETLSREAAHKDLDVKIDKLAQAIDAEKSARNVGDHQLSAQVERVASSLEDERSSRQQESVSQERVLAAMRHDLETEMNRSAETWNQHLEMVKRIEVRLEDHSAMMTQHEQRVTQLDSDSDKLQAMSLSLEATVAAQHRALQEDLHKRSEDLTKAVQDEALGREHHIMRFAKDLETSWHSLEARVKRVREESSEGKATLLERARVLDQRFAELEHGFACHVETQATKDHALQEKVQTTCTVVDQVELAQKASEVVLQNTTAKVDDCMERICVAESDLQQKVAADYWRPQIDSFQRSITFQEGKLAQLEKEMATRFAQESLQRDSDKVQLQDTMKACLDKVNTGFAKQGQQNAAEKRFIEVANDGSDTPKMRTVPTIQVNMPQPMTQPMTQSMSAELASKGVVRQMSSAIYPGANFVATSPRRSQSPLQPSFRPVPVAAPPPGLATPSSPLVPATVVLPQQ